MSVTTSRPASYEAAYTALVANRRPDPQAAGAGAQPSGGQALRVRRRRRGCDVDLPADLAVGDVLAVPATGAWALHGLQLPTSSLAPGVRWVREGESGWILRPAPSRTSCAWRAEL